jgi:serine/threonine-protein kinase
MTAKNSPNFGRYEVVAELGQGAMGVVYKARDPKIERLVAIKTIALRGHNAKDEGEFRERFFNEARAAGRLNHPRIITIFDVGEELEEHDPYIVMEYVAGESLEEHLASGRKLPLANVLQLVQEIAEALDYAHTQGIVHRDIKPANIMLTEEGHAKIADFGVAKLNLSSLTVSGNTLGTPAFMSPEQLNGEAVDGRSDLFSLGVILYTLLTGYRPFQGNSALTISFKVVNREPVPISALDPNLSPGLDYIVSRAIAKPPSERYQTGMEMALDLQDVQQNFIPRSSMTPRSSGSAQAQKLFEDVSQGTGQFAALQSSGTTNPHLTALAAKRARAKRLSSSVVWQLAVAVVLGAGVFGLGFTLFRTHVPGEDVAPVRPQKHEEVSVAVETERRNEAPSLQAGDSSGTGMPLEKQETAAQPRPVRKQRAIHAVVAVNATTRPAVAPAESGRVQVMSVVKSSPGATVALATLHIRVEHRFPEAEVMLWIDDKLAYEHSVAGAVKKRMVVFKAVEGHESDSVRTSAGDHQIRVRVQSEDKVFDDSGTISATLPADGERSLRIVCEKHKPIRLWLQ